MSDDLTKRVQNAANGITPQTKPDERRHFLGSLRERVFVAMTNEEAQDESLTDLFLEHMEDFRDYQILINGKITNQVFLTQVEASASKAGIPFTLVNNETAQIGAKEVAILVVSKVAINRPRIGLKQVYPPEMPKEALPNSNKKVSFWKRLFGGK